MFRPFRNVFESLSVRNYRLWFFSAVVANTGTWMQRVAQDWLVLKILTDDSASATGITTALQFLPAVFLSAHAGVVADRVDTRRLLLVTQLALGLVSGALAADVLAGHAQLWHVYLAAALTGVAAAYDAPARQILVARLVPPEHLANAVALNSVSFNAARLLGPAVAGLVVAAVGPGWVFFVNALTFLLPSLVLVMMRVAELYEVPRAPRAKGQIREGLSYVRHRTDILLIIVMAFVISLLTLNFQLTMAAMVRSVFDLQSEAYGTVSSVFALGSLAGALLGARRKTPRVRTVILAAGVLGVMTLLLAVMPTFWSFAAMTVPTGLVLLTLLTAANQTVQMSTDPVMRGRVMSLYMLAFLGAGAVGAPLVGWISDQWGPRCAIGVGGVGALLVALGAGLWARWHWQVDISYSSTRPFLRTSGPRERAQEQETAGPGPLGR